MKNLHLKKNLLLFALCMVVFLTACTTTVTPLEEPQPSEGAVVFTSFNVIYEFTRILAEGTDIHVAVLSPPGADAHHWEPSVQDMAALQTADLFIYHGAGIEHYVDSLRENVDTRFITASDGVDPEHDYTDPHYWLNPLNAMFIMYNIRNALEEIQPHEAERLERNFAAASNELLELYLAYQAAAENFTRHTIIVTHAAFGHMAHFLGIEQVAMEGHHHGADPSPAHMAEIIALVEEAGITTIFYDKDPSLAETAAAATGAETAMLDTIEGFSGDDYFTAMWRNLETLTAALTTPPSP